MLKMEIISPKREIKMKIEGRIPQIIQGNFQEKIAKPSIELQEILPDDRYDALSKVIIEAVNSEIDDNIISENIKDGVEILGIVGNYDNRKEEQSKSVEITQNGVINVYPDENKVLNEVNINANILPDTSDATATADDIASGKTAYIAEGKVVGIAPQYWDNTKRTSGRLSLYLTNAPMIDTSGYTSFNDFFSYYGGETLPLIDTSNGTSFTNFVNGSSNLVEIPQFDFSKGKSFNNCFPSSTTAKLETIPLLDLGNANAMSSFIGTLPKLKNLGGFKDLGKNYGTSQSANYYAYTLDLSKATALTEQSLINVLNNLYDIATKGCNTQKCTLGSTNLGKLTSVEGQQALSNATAKGWTIA